MKYIALLLVIVSLVANAEQESVIGYSSGVCEGFCPVYEIFLFDDDLMILDARRNLNINGIHRIQMEKGTFAQVKKYLQKAKYKKYATFYSIENESNCKSLALDAPIKTIRFVKKGSSKAIKHDLGCRGFPREDVLRELQKNIEAILIMPYLKT